jgi:hypothetical protein
MMINEQLLLDAFRKTSELGKKLIIQYAVSMVEDCPIEDDPSISGQPFDPIHVALG